MFRITKLGLLSFAVALAALSGCATAGNVAGESAKSVIDLMRSDPEQSLRTAVAKSEDVASVAFSVAGKETGEDVTVSGKAQFGAKAIAELHLTEDGKAITVLVRGPVMHISMAGQDVGGIKGKKWLRMDLSTMTPEDRNTIGGNPDEFSEILNDVNPKAQLQQMIDVGAFKAAGQETMDGARTVHYVSTIPVDKFLAASLPAERAKVQKAYAAAGVKNVTFDVWVDEKYQLRKAKLLAGTVDDWTATYSGHNEPLTLTVPTAAETLDWAQLMAAAKKAPQA